MKEVYQILNFLIDEEHFVIVVNGLNLHSKIAQAESGVIFCHMAHKRIETEWDFGGD